MKKGSCLLNVGRGNAIDPDGLYKVLSEGWLKAAALDVTEPEPLPADDKLWGLGNIIITPHCAGGNSLATTSYRFLNIASENIKHYLNGEEFVNVVDKKLGY